MDGHHFNVNFWYWDGTPVYPVLRSSSSIKVKVKSQGKVKSQVPICVVYTTIDAFTNGVILATKIH